MQRIAILGGMSPESTTLYYEHITRSFTARYGDFSYPEILIFSVQFQNYVNWQRNGQWAEAAADMAAAFDSLHRAGASFGLIASNTMHFVFDEVQRAAPLPLLSIVDATVDAIRAAGLSSVALLGTNFTMRERFFLDGLQRAGITPLVPDLPTQDQIHSIIFDQLCRGQLLDASRDIFLRAIDQLQARGAQGVILGCTEIPLLVKPTHTPLPLFNTALIHAERALDRALSQDV